MLRAASESATNMATTDRRALPTTPRGVGAAARDERESEGSLQPHIHASGVRPPPLPDPIEGRCLGGKLLVGERIGSGALGAVYRAKHVLLPQPIAVKVLHPHCRAEPTYRARFLAEAQSASMLDHPNLVRVVDFGEERGGLMWLAMELLDGRSIDTVQRDLQGGCFSVERAVAILLDVCAGLAHAHERGIVHGDVKPSNVVLVMHTNDDGEALERAKLCDFGVARFRAPSLTPERGDAARETPSQRRMESGTQPSFLAAGAFGGTPAYMSPEQCVGDELDARSDVYSCGVLFHELITGEVPFSGVESNAGAVLRKHLLAPPTLPSAHRTNIDTRIDAIVAKSLAKDPSDRFASMRELRAALRDLSCGLGLPIRASVAPMPVPTPAPTTTLTLISPVAASGVVPATVRSPSLTPSSPADPFRYRGSDDLETEPAPAPPVMPSSPYHPRKDGPHAAHDGERRAHDGRADTDQTPAHLRVATEVRALSQHAEALPGATSSLAPPRRSRGAAPTADLADFLRARAELLDREQHALTELLQRGSAEAVAWRVARLIARAESSRGRDTVAVETLALLDTPTHLQALAERLLSEDVASTPNIERMIQRASRSFVRSLWSARIAAPDRSEDAGRDEARRARFVTWMKLGGDAALDLLRMALMKLVPHAESGHYLELIEDVLLALPAKCDDDVVSLVAPFASSPSDRVRIQAHAIMVRALV